MFVAILISKKFIARIFNLFCKSNVYTMNDIQSLIDRQLGIYCRLNYDNVLKRLVVDRDESFYGLQSGHVIENFDPDPPIFACRFAEAAGFENILALANEDGRVAIQDTTNVKTAGLLESFQCHNNAVFDLAWMPGQMNFVTVSGDHTACLWDVAEGAPKRVLVFSNHTRSVKTAVFRPTESSVFATGARDGHILIWDIRAYNQQAVVLKPDNCLTSCHSSFAPKTPGSHGKRARLDAPRAISITGLVFQDAHTLLSCGECDGNIKAWDLRKNYNAYRREPLPKHSIPYCGSSAKNGYTNLILDEARTRLYASCMDDVIYCFNVAAYGTLPERRYVGHDNGSFYIKTGLSPDGAYLVSGSSDKRAYLWSVRRAEPLARLAGHRAEVTCAAWGPRGDTKIVTCGDDARHKIWRVGPEAFPSDADLQGCAEPAPPARAAQRPEWGARDRTPSSLKRRASATPAERSAKRARDASAPAPATERKTKRCLLAMLNGGARDADEAEAEVKRLRLDSGAEEARAGGVKRPHPESGASWHYPAPRAGTSFLTPTKVYEARSCRNISPRELRRRSPSPAPAPGAARGVTFATPTKNLPNFVLDGEAPHLRLMSPAKKKLDAPDWLTLMVRERRGRGGGGGGGGGSAGEVERLGCGGTVAPPSPKENCPPPRRNSVSDKTPRSNKKSGTLLKYFSAAGKDKSEGK